MALHPLEYIVYEEYERNSWATRLEEKQVKKIIMKDNSFGHSANHALEINIPLDKVFRMIDGDKTLKMWFIYEAINKVKEDIARDLEEQESTCK